jgi:pimeloyl-ACP methyl ester carboxylesterase
MSVQPFVISIPDAVLVDLEERLARTRWPADMENDDWRYGTPRAYLEELVDYWRNGYNWRLREELMNARPHFRADVEGLPIHFIQERGKGPNPVPLVLTHGWPWTFMDFEDVLGPLTDPAAFGGDERDSFDVVVPSLPGFGFSVPVEVPGVNFERTADLWVTLMTEVLGYERFAAHGGDFGQLITTQLGHKHSDQLLGIHISGAMPLDLMSGLPGDDEYSEDEADRVAYMKVRMRHGMSHAAVQTVEPQTLAYGMHDSPVALLAWLVNRRYWWSDCAGDIETRFSKDDLLDMTMLYWVNDGFVSSARYYWEAAHHPWKPAHDRTPQVPSPTAIAIAPEDVLYMPRRWMETFFDLRQLTFLESGGHFAAKEEPEAVVEDIRRFFRTLR